MAGPPGTERRSGAAWQRALVAVALWLGFYAVSLGVAAGLFLLPYAQSRFEGAVGFSGWVCIIGGLSVLWAIFPRLERFEPPSQALASEAYPQFGRLVTEVAAKVGHPEPQDLFLIHEGNAFAGHRKRQWYRRGRSVVGVGLVLFEILAPDELATVVAHEMGHHFAGDVLLGPWIHRIRRAIAGALERMEGSSFWLHLPFVGYGALFLRVTRRSAREQELAADALAARSCGVAATAAALVRLHRLGPLWEAYWDSEVVPLLNLGFRPPLLDGFRSMVKLPRVRQELDTAARKASEREPSFADTHPRLSDRLAALEAGDPGVDQPAGGIARWFDDPDAAELVVVKSVLRDPSRALPFVTWQEAGEKAWMPHWKETLAPFADAFREVTIEGFPELAADPSRLVARLRGGLAILSPQAERQRALRLLGAWLCVTLHGRGFSVQAEPGDEVRLVRDGVTLEPHTIIRELGDGSLGAEAWRLRCAELGPRLTGDEAATAP
jgi:Zn-dependent protease with chaperone function